MVTSMNRRNSDVVMATGSRNSADAPKKNELSMDNLFRIYDPSARRRRNVPKKRIIEDGQQNDVWHDAHENSVSFAREDLKAMLVPALDTLNSAVRLIFRKSLSRLLHEELSEQWKNVNFRDQAMKFGRGLVKVLKDPSVITYIACTVASGAWQVGLFGPILKFVLPTVVKDYFTPKRNKKQNEELFDECPSLKGEQKTQFRKFMDQFYAWLVIPPIWFMVWKFLGIKMNQKAIMDAFFKLDSYRAKETMVNAIVKGTDEDVDFSPLLDLIDVLDDKTFAELFDGIVDKIRNPLYDSLFTASKPKLRNLARYAS
jgi:hypothetical protein